MANRENPHLISYNALALRAQIRAALLMLIEIDGYGERSEAGEALCDLGFLLMDAEAKLDEIHGLADKLESQPPQTAPA